MPPPRRFVPGEVVFGDGDIELFAGRPLIEVEVVNTGDRPMQVGSHYHFAETNPALQFDRAAARGYRLAIPAGTSVRFEPGIEQIVDLGADRRRSHRARPPRRDRRTAVTRA